MFRFLPILLVLSACSSVSGPISSRSAPLVVGSGYFIEHSAPSQAALQSAVDAAIAGDDAKLAYVIELERYTDGEGSLNFGDLLLQIRSRIGITRFDSVLAGLSTQVQDGAKGCMEAAAGTRRAYEQYLRQHSKT